MNEGGSNRRAAVAWCVWQYYEVTNAQEFLSMYGAEMFLEIARFWASIAEYNEVEDRYEIRGVIGPDEFHTAYPGRDESEPGINNNAYTNVMAAWVLARAGDILERLSPHRKQSIVRRLGIADDELGTQAPALLERALSCANLRIDGLMTIAPLSDDPAVARHTFARLRSCRDSLEQEFGCKLSELSMGMSDDFEAAVCEGSTLLRLGSVLFGPRETG